MPLLKKTFIYRPFKNVQMQGPAHNVFITLYPIPCTLDPGRRSYTASMVDGGFVAIL